MGEKLGWLGEKLAFGCGALFSLIVVVQGALTACRGGGWALFTLAGLGGMGALVLLGVLCLGFGIGMETIAQWGPWMDLVSIYIIPIGATLGAVSWFYVMKKDALLAAVNTGSKKRRGALWYGIGRYVYVPLAIILCCVALFMKIAF